MGVAWLFGIGDPGEVNWAKSSASIVYTFLFSQVDIVVELRETVYGNTSRIRGGLSSGLASACTSPSVVQCVQTYSVGLVERAGACLELALWSVESFICH